MCINELHLKNDLKKTSKNLKKPQKTSKPQNLKTVFSKIGSKVKQNTRKNANALIHNV